MPDPSIRPPRLGGILLVLIAALSLPAAPVSATCPSPSLKNAVRYPQGTGPVEVTVGDWNGDGVPDVAITQSGYPTGPGSIELRPGQSADGHATGTFGPGTTLPVGGVPLGITSTDLEGDGDPDLIACDWASNQVLVLRGLGGSLFESPRRFAVGLHPYELVTGDFNADGVPDVAVALNGQSGVQVLLAGRDTTGHWDGTFAEPVTYPTANLSLSIVAGDFNADGILDLAATESFSQSVAVFLGLGSAGQGDGTFRLPVHIPAGLEPYDLATSDFNEDGRLDLAVANSSTGGVHILLGSNSGFFPVEEQVLVGSNCSGVAVADLDGDGILDLAVSRSPTASLALLKGQGDAGVGNGTFGAPVSLEDCCFPLHVVSADLDVDGNPDVITCGYDSNSLGVFLDGCDPDLRAPRIAGIRDVPNDQGGKVFLTWLASSLDVTGGSVLQYRVWRMVPPGAVATRAREAGSAWRAERIARPDGAAEVVFWEPLATLPAQRLAGYGYTAATPQDSLPTGNPRFTYRVSALTANVDVFYDSDPDSGYSVDNLAPSAPAGLVARAIAGGTQLSWTANGEPDLDRYRLYRSHDPAFVPSPATLIAALTGTTYTDPLGAGSAFKLVAVDVHGNTSAAASVNAPATTDVGGRPALTWLGEPSPNPARDALELRFGLARASSVSLAIFDQQGRLVRTLVRGPQAAGDASVRWDARDGAGRRVAAGIYYVRLVSGGQRWVRRIVHLD